jgi:hypothetical protein
MVQMAVLKVVTCPLQLRLAAFGCSIRNPAAL